MSGPEFAAALSEHPVAGEAIGEVIGEIENTLGTEPDLAVLFVTGHHLAAAEVMAAAVRRLLRPAHTLGTTAVSVIGGSREVEERPGVVLWAARLPGARLDPVRLEVEPGADGLHLTGLPEPGSSGTLLLLADPFTFPVDGFLSAMSEQAPGLTVVGGLASAAGGAGINRLILDDDVNTGGAVGILTDQALTTVVSQGCRPIGAPYIVTASEGNRLLQLGGQPAITRLEELIAGADEAERELMGRGLHLGVVIDETKVDFTRGDFLIRGVFGIDREVGAVVVGDRVEVGTTVQFHVRDAATADEDLRTLLAGHDAASALVFTCNGRGSHLFDVPDHDASTVHRHLDEAPVAGMFCAGEVGPIGSRSFLHGFTASVVLFGGPGAI